MCVCWLRGGGGGVARTNVNTPYWEGGDLLRREVNASGICTELMGRWRGLPLYVVHRRSRELTAISIWRWSALVGFTGVSSIGKWVFDTGRKEGDKGFIYM